MNDKNAPKPPNEGALKAMGELVVASLQKRRYEWITAEELKAHIDSGQPVTFVDCRDQATYAFGHIHSAVNVPYRHFMDEIGRVPHNDGLVVAGCYVGFYSRAAAQKLAHVGHPSVLSLKGGVQSWIDAGYPTVEGM